MSERTNVLESEIGRRWVRRRNPHGKEQQPKDSNAKARSNLQDCKDGHELIQRTPHYCNSVQELLLWTVTLPPCASKYDASMAK